MRTSDVVKTEVVVQSETGLNAYAVARLVQTVTQYDADIHLQVANRVASAKGFLDVMSLGATAGDGVEVMASGPDAVAALHALRVLFLSAFEVCCSRTDVYALSAPRAA